MENKKKLSKLVLKKEVISNLTENITRGGMNALLGGGYYSQCAGDCWSDGQTGQKNEQTMVVS